MSLLIIGGLLAFAVIAILAAVLLGMGEQRADKSRVAQPQPSRAVATSAPSLPPATPAASAELPAPAAILDATTVDLSEQQQVNRTLRRTVPLSQELPMPVEAPRHVTHAEYVFPSLNGQFREFADELHALHEQAWELEQRILSLTEILDRMGNTQEQHQDISDEKSLSVTPSDAL